MHIPLVKDSPSVQEALDSSQKTCSFAVDLKAHHDLFSSLEGNEREQACLNSASLPHAGDWLNVIPNWALGLMIQSNEYVAAIKYRLGVFVYDTQGPCPACNKESDTMGDHAVGCHKLGEMITRQNSLRDDLFRSAAQAGLAPTREERNLLAAQVDHENQRPGDIKVCN